MSAHNRIAIDGQKFGRLTVQRRAPNNERGEQWLCLCECGKTKVAVGSDLRRGMVKSCGCLIVDHAKQLNARFSLKHGEARQGKRSREYLAWEEMWRRVRGTAGQDSKAYYTDRGITVCDRWRHFENFLADMGRKPSPDFTLDRIDNDRGYEMANCRWATRQMQATNKRRLKTTSTASRFFGVVWRKDTKKWQAQITVAGKRRHLGAFKSEEAAAHAYDAVAREHYGKYAQLNFPGV